MKGITELKGTFAFNVLLHQLNVLAEHAESNVIESARTKPVEYIRYQAGVAAGIRQVINALTTSEE